MKDYAIDTDHPTQGCWREDPSGNRYASATLPDGRRFHLAVVRDKRVRIPYKPRGQNYGWTWAGYVRDVNGKVLASDRVQGSIGVRGLLELAGLVPPTRCLTCGSKRHRSGPDCIRWRWENGEKTPVPGPA